MSDEALIRRMRNYLDRQRACLEHIEARLDAHAKGDLDWEAWFDHADGDLAQIVQLAEEYALLRAEWNDGSLSADAALETEARDAGARATKAARRFFAVVEEAKADLGTIGEELAITARGRAMLRNYRAADGPSAPHIDTHI